MDKIYKFIKSVVNVLIRDTVSIISTIVPLVFIHWLLEHNIILGIIWIVIMICEIYMEYKDIK